MVSSLYFRYNERLGIPLPLLRKDWDEYGADEREAVITAWEHIRGAIPERIIELERRITGKLTRMNEEADFERCCQLNSQIAEIASTINDLHIWFRANQDVAASRAHS